MRYLTKYLSNHLPKWEDIGYKLQSSQHQCVADQLGIGFVIGLVCLRYNHCRIGIGETSVLPRHKPGIYPDNGQDGR